MTLPSTRRRSSCWSRMLVGSLAMPKVSSRPILHGLHALQGWPLHCLHVLQGASSHLRPHGRATFICAVVLFVPLRDEVFSNSKKSVAVRSSTVSMLSKVGLSTVSHVLQGEPPHLRPH